MIFRLEEGITALTNNNNTSNNNNSIRPTTLLELHKLGFKLVPLSQEKSTPALQWTVIYENPNFWSEERFINQAVKFKNVATTFGRTYIRNSHKTETTLYLNGLDSDSKAVHTILTQPLIELQEKYPSIYSKIENIFSQRDKPQTLLKGLQNITCVVKTRKSYGFHIYWFSSKPNKQILSLYCKPGSEFEIKTGKSLCTLPPSTHRND